jgi:enoyl-CoA hydratase
MSELIVTRHGRVLQLTLNRPAARNALNNALLTQLAEQLEAAAVDADIAVCVIYGSERCFAAGADLNEMAEKDLPATLNDIRPQLWARINAFPKPLIAAVNGFALGAGCELALLCDVVLLAITPVSACRKSRSALCPARAAPSVLSAASVNPLPAKWC